MQHFTLIKLGCALMQAPSLQIGPVGFIAIEAIPRTYLLRAIIIMHCCSRCMATNYKAPSRLSGQNLVSTYLLMSAANYLSLSTTIILCLSSLPIPMHQGTGATKQARMSCSCVVQPLIKVQCTPWLRCTQASVPANNFLRIKGLEY